eukprot:5612217-Pleurochrysis_carterae.AAC.1
MLRRKSWRARRVFLTWRVEENNTLISRAQQKTKMDGARICAKAIFVSRSSPSPPIPQRDGSMSPK